MCCCDALDKYCAVTARDAQCLTELRGKEQGYWQFVAESKDAVDEDTFEFRCLLIQLLTRGLAFRAVLRLCPIWLGITSGCFIVYSQNE